MNARVLLLAGLMTLVGGCQSFGEYIDERAERVQAPGICVFVDTDDDWADNCDVNFWLSYWSAVNTMTWTERKAQIENLSEEPADTLKKVLLCQGNGTPYQDRLRAQGWVTSLMPMLSDNIQQFVTVAIYQSSQELLELESALVTLGKISTNQAIRVEEQRLLSGQQKNQIEQQKLLLDQQQSQIEQLLKIEASIMDNTKGDKP
ncbi:MAG: hypothetical protein ACI965_000557 [Paraglaciecola sp.]|jgi:hypothetical protein